MAVKISGFTIVRNAIKNDYPAVESITSILPVVDEMIVSIGNSDDDTEGLIRSINSPKIKIVHSVWDPALRQGGRVLAVETDKARQHISADSDWAFYIQADEVVHEKYHSAIRQAAEQYKDNTNVEGLVFKYTHFYGTYDYIGDSRRWYHQEIRIIRNIPGISSFRDAQGFRRDEKRLNCKLIDAYIYHYGWVKSPLQMKIKCDSMSEFWYEDGEERQKLIESRDVFNFSDFDSLQEFTGSHPVVMQERIRKANWNLKLDISKKKFSFIYWLLYRYEKITGIRPFAFRNYNLI
ncbi:MAG: glycosyltransferase family 2 protein [Ignavibacteria bacterium]|nr:glycosyltransferase family 2 protein [Ignavibacteria bacterium]